MTTHKVLIVDDELPIRDMLRMALETAGYECLEAETIDVAYHQIVDDRHDIVLLDWMLLAAPALNFCGASSVLR